LNAQFAENNYSGVERAIFRSTNASPSIHHSVDL